MIRNSGVRSIKPALEQLEDRLTPTILFGSNAINTLVTSLNSVLTDMQGAQTKLTTDFNNAQTALGNNPNGDNVRLFTIPFGKAVADYQQILNDQATIHLMVSTDNSFIQQVALAEAISGDPIDFIILTFFKGSAFDPTSQLTNVQKQADQILQDPTLQNEIGFTFKLGNNATVSILNNGEFNTPGYGH